MERRVAEVDHVDHVDQELREVRDAVTDVAAPASPPLSQGRLLGLPVSKLAKRRWEQFRANRRAFVSLWIFLGLFALTLPAELVANDKPLVVRYDGALYSPFSGPTRRRPSAATSAPRRSTVTPS